MRRVYASLGVKLALLVLLLYVPIISVATNQFEDVAKQLALVTRERRGVDFLRAGSALLEALSAVRLAPRPLLGRASVVDLRAEDRSEIAKRLASLERIGAQLGDIGVAPSVTVPVRAAWRRFEGAPGPVALAEFGGALVDAENVAVDASRLSFEASVVEADLGDALAENAIVLQRSSAASAIAELGALRGRTSLADRIAIATHVANADAALVTLAIDRAGVAAADAPLAARLGLTWTSFERAAAAERAPLALVVLDRRSVAVTAPALAQGRRRLAAAYARSFAQLVRELGLRFDARQDAGRRMQDLILAASLLAALLCGAVVLLMGRAVVRRDRRELVGAWQQARALAAELAQQRAETALLLTQAQFSAIFERSNMGIALLAANGETLEANARLKEMLREAEVIPPRDVAFAQLVRGATQTYHCERSLERDGVPQWLEMTVSLVAGAPSTPVTAIAMIRDITERKVLEERMSYAASHDALTSLANRSQFVACVELQLAARATETSACAVLFIDLDDFKLVNDTLGHHAGDQVLLVTARRILAASRDIDLVARFHGDEFAVLLREIAGEVAAEAAAERIRRELIAPMSIDGKLVVISSSIGIVMGHAGHACAEDVLRHADAAMYRVKPRGRSSDLALRQAARLTSVSSIAS